MPFIGFAGEGKRVVPVEERWPLGLREVERGQVGGKI